MFKKLITNLPFNPSLVGQVAFYAKRVHQEATIRRMGFGLVALAMFIQMFAVIAPPQPSLASSDSSIIKGAIVQTKEGILAKYDASPFVQAVYASMGISRDDINKMVITNIDKRQDIINGTRNLITAGRAPHTDHDNVINVTSSEYNAPIYQHSINVTFPNDNLIPVLFCPRETCGAIKMIILACGNPVIDLNEPAPEPIPVGHVDSSNCSLIWGWAWNGNHDRFVHFYVDKPAFFGAIKDKDYFEVYANQPRPDVRAVRNEIPAEVGYSWDGTPSLKNDGRSHQLWVYVTDRGSHYAPLIGGEGVTVNFNCPVPPPAVPTPIPVTPTPIPMCTVAGKTSLLADDANCREPVASCDLLGSTNDQYQVKTAVSFYGRATANFGATIASYDVDFGDSNGRLQSFTNRDALTHTYQTVGTYKVKLYVQTSLGQKTAATCNKTVTITPVPVKCPSKLDILQTDARCKPCVEHPEVQEDHASCIPTIVKQKKVSNTTQKIADFNNKTAKQSDVLEYTLITTNVSNKIAAKDIVVQEAVTDLLNYADITDLHGGTLNPDSKVISWDKETILAGKTSTHVLGVKIKAVIPATPVSSADSSSFDLKMVNVYGDSITVNLPCAGAKCIETLTTALPDTGPGTSLIVGFMVTMVVGYFLARSRLLAKELDLIRADYAPTGGF